MSLRTLATRVDGSASSHAPSGVAGRAALVFVFNREFLWPFKVLAFSLIKAGSLLDLPVIVISEDRSLEDEPLIEEIADRFVVADDRLLGQFANISGERVVEQLRLDWIAKYTLLKWLVFDDYGYDRHVYMDADVLCLNAPDELATLGDADLYLSPRFEPTLIRVPGVAPLPRPEREANVLAFASQDSFENINTGVFVANRAVLGPGFRGELIATAERLKIRTEQSVIQRVLADEPSYSRRWLAPQFNFHHGHLGALTVRTQIDLLATIKLLHFIGSEAKPWDGERAKPLISAVWRGFAKEAAERDPIFARKPQ